MEQRKLFISTGQTLVPLARAPRLSLELKLQLARDAKAKVSKLSDRVLS